MESGPQMPAVKSYFCMTLPRNPSRPENLQCGKPIWPAGASPAGTRRDFLQQYSQLCAWHACNALSVESALHIELSGATDSNGEHGGCPAEHRQTCPLAAASAAGAVRGWYPFGIAWAHQHMAFSELKWWRAECATTKRFYGNLEWAKAN